MHPGKANTCNALVMLFNWVSTVGLILLYLYIINCNAICVSNFSISSFYNHLEKNYKYRAIITLKTMI